MPEFIVDANLPFRILKWQNDLFVHVLNINPLWNDEEIWSYTQTNNLIIITKDKDFRLKQIMQVEKIIKDHSLINIYQSSIEAIK